MKTIKSITATLIAIAVSSSAKALPKKECSVTYTGPEGKSESTLPISQDITTKKYGNFQVKVELKKNGSTEVVIEASGMKAMQSGSGSGTTKASLSNGNERIEVICR